MRYFRNTEGFFLLTNSTAKMRKARKFKRPATEVAGLLFRVNTHTLIRIKEESRNTLTGLSYKRNTSKFYSAIRSGIPSQNQNLLVPQE